MSVAQLVTGSPEPLAAPRRRAVLTVVPVRAVAEQTRGPFAAAVVALLVAGLFGLLFLNTVLGKDSFHLHELRVQAVELADREQTLIREVEALRAPGTLAEKATEMGMVQAGPPAFLRLSDGAVLGATDPAAAPLGPEGEAVAGGTAEAEVTTESESESESESETAEPDSAESDGADSESTSESTPESTSESTEAESTDSE